MQNITTNTKDYLIVFGIYVVTISTSIIAIV